MDIQLFVAFGAGVLSFISPCCLPLYPAFLSYITGMSVSDLKSDYALLQRRSLLHTLFFCSDFHLFLLLSVLVRRCSDNFSIHTKISFVKLVQY